VTDVDLDVNVNVNVNTTVDLDPFESSDRIEKRSSGRTVLRGTGAPGQRQGQGWRSGSGSRRRQRALIGLLVLAACKDAPSKLAAPRPGEIGLAGTAIKLDGELDEPGWNARATRGVFLGPDGKLARPYSEIRLLADADAIYVALYAADEDIESSDRFDIAVGTLAFAAHPDGKVEPAVPAAVDRDGTLDKPSDDDEEWVVELAIPRDQLGEGPLAITAQRCDTPKDRRPRCGQWSATLSPPPRR
jgi:hypothetical protein